MSYAMNVVNKLKDCISEIIYMVLVRFVEVYNVYLIWL